jgi:hypothetical protein
LRSTGGRFPHKIAWACSSLQDVTKSDVARLTDRQRVMFGEKLLELANYAVAALIFGQLVSQQRISFVVMLAGLGSYMALVLVGLWLTGAE